MLGYDCDTNYNADTIHCRLCTVFCVPCPTVCTVQTHENITVHILYSTQAIQDSTVRTLCASWSMCTAVSLETPEGKLCPGNMWSLAPGSGGPKRRMYCPASVKACHRGGGTHKEARRRARWARRNMQRTEQRRQGRTRGVGSMTGPHGNTQGGQSSVFRAGRLQRSITLLVGRCSECHWE